MIAKAVKLAFENLRLGVTIVAVTSATIASGAALAQDFVVNEAQAARGQVVYDGACVGCHGAGLNGANGPELHGGLFVIHWGGKPAADLFTFMRENMPAGAPGSLHSDEYRDVLATILAANGYPVAADAPEINKDTDLAVLTIEDKTKK